MHTLARRSRSINLISRFVRAYTLTLNNHAVLDCNSVNDDAGSTYCRCFAILSPTHRGERLFGMRDDCRFFVLLSFVFTARHSSSFSLSIEYARNAMCSPEMLARIHAFRCIKTQMLACSIYRKHKLTRWMNHFNQLTYFLWQIDSIMKIEKLNNYFE